METAVSLLVVGTVLIILELFVPGGVLGSVGLITFFAGIILVSPNIYWSIGLILLTIILIYLIIKFLLKNSSGKRLFLNTKLGSEEGVLSSKENDTHIGEVMIVDTFLRPSGKIKKDGQLYDAMSEGEFIEKGKQVVVVGNKGYILLVKNIQTK